MFNKIIDPYNNKSVDINSKKGINIIKNYIKLLKGGSKKSSEPTHKYLKLGSEFYDIKEYLGSGVFGRVYAVDVYNSEGENLSTNELCIKVEIIQSRKENDNEYNIGKKLSDNGIAPRILNRFVTVSKKIKKKIIDRINLDIENEKRNNFLKLLSNKKKHLSIIIMQRLKGIGYEDTTEFDGKEIRDIKDSEKEIVCDKINNMHKLGIIHNDLNPGNIFLDEKEPYLIDFGYSQIIEENDGSKANIKYKNEKTLKNYYNDTGKTPENLGNFDDIQTTKKQFCKKAGWACERAWQAEQIHKDCSDNWGKTPLKYKSDLIEIAESDDSGYL